jgi:hypothetical protein
MKKQLGLVLLAGLVIFIGSCSNKSSDLSKARLEIRLTDDPAGFDAVYIDIQDIKYNVTGDSVSGWQSLDGIQKGVYNLLDLVNDKDTLLANSEIPSGRLHQIRLVLGTNNSVVVNGINIPLSTPSAQQSGLKLNIQQDVLGGLLYTILLDFDAAKSIVKTGNSKFILKPVIRTILKAAGGSIAGNVKPAEIKTAVLAIQGMDTVASTFTAMSGGYLIKGIAAGTYDLHFLPTDTTYQKAIRNGIAVTTGNVTLVDTVQLIK